MVVLLDFGRYLKWTRETHPWLKGKFHIPKVSHIRHSLLMRGEHLCCERPPLVHPPGEPIPKWDPKCPAPPWPCSPHLPPAKPVQPQNLLQSPNPCSLLMVVSHQKGLKEEKGVQQGLGEPLWQNAGGPKPPDAVVGPQSGCQEHRLAS